jgi:Zn-dependent peptidase ImmA (M78 family)
MANKTNTVKKGDAFENKVYSKIKELLELGNFLGINSKHSHIHQKKTYKGTDGTYIEFDISIETYMPNATEYSLLTLIECKDYNSSIQGEKLDSFAHRIKKVGAHKGIFITTKKFQSAAFKVAKANGIGLVIINRANELEWKLSRIGKSRYEMKQDIENYIIDTKNVNKYPFIAVLDNHYYTSIIDFLSDIIEQELRLPFEIPFLKAEEIEDIILNIFKQKNRNDLQYYMKTEELIDIMKNQLEINLDFDSVLDDKIGHCDFKNNKISITSAMRYDSPRWRFTLTHELGHYILHRYLYEKYGVDMANDDEGNFSINELNNNSKQMLEIQANIFASKILIPDKAFKSVYFQLHKSLALRNFPELYIDNQRCNISSYHNITGKIAQRFGVSKEVVKYKLLEFKLLKLGPQLPYNWDIYSEEDNSYSKSHFTTAFQNLLSYEIHKN